MIMESLSVLARAKGEVAETIAIGEEALAKILV